MRKILTTFSALFFLVASTQAQVVINEIMYNIPGIAAENEEYFELYNAGTAPVTLNDYDFTQGINYTFPAAGTAPVILAPGAYYVIAKDSMAFQAAYGMFPDASWTSGSLSNSGEDIILVDASGAVVDSVDYDDGNAWPTDADGAGFALQLCDPATDNADPANWSIGNDVSGTVTDVNGTYTTYGTPGMANVCAVILPPAYPLYTIDQIDAVDTDGVADSNGVTAELRGVAHCVNFRANSGGGYDFRLANYNNIGIRIFSFSDVDNYTFTEGDSLHIKGTIGQFRGGLQFIPDSIMIASSGNMTLMPMTVTVIDESTENKYVQLNNMYLVDAAQWIGGGSTFNVDITSGNGDTITMRVDDDTNLSNEPAPMGTFSIAGWGGQNDPSSPFTEDYQLLPCAATQLVNVSQPAALTMVRIYPNPASTVFTVETATAIQTVLVHNALGQVVLALDNVATNSAQINTNNLSNGIYTVSVVTGEQITTQLVRVAK